jgi:two-component system nitrogen regulation sensor histidine kinase GlnL
VIVSQNQLAEIIVELLPQEQQARQERTEERLAIRRRPTRDSARNQAHEIKKSARRHSGCRPVAGWK